MRKHVNFFFMKIMFAAGCITLFSLISMAQTKADTSHFNVSKYGTKADGSTNDLPALLKCFTEATKQKGTVVVEIPYGRYNIDQELKINTANCDLLIIKGIPSNGKLPEISSKKFTSILQVFSYYWAPKGAVEISNIAVRGNNVPYSASHPYYDKPASCNGISIINLKKVNIHDNTVKDIYGNGILVAYSNISKDLNNRYDYVEIADNNVSNCWGLHPTKSSTGTVDDYGDGIYTNSIKKGRIINNKVVNDITQTKQFGRVGIDLEFYDEDCEVSKNYIFGYDRNIHLEGDIGGHMIHDNKLEGSDFGILVYSSPSLRNKPVTITSNYISNKGLPRNNKLTRVRNSEERCLLSFYATGGCRAGSKIDSNEFMIDPNSDYKFTSIVRFLEKNLKVEGNNFSSQLPVSVRKSINFFYPVESIQNNTFNNVDLNFKSPGNQVVNNQNKGNKTLNKVNSNIKVF